MQAEEVSIRNPALNLWCFSVMAVAVTMTAAVAHLMELPAKMRYDGIVQPVNAEVMRWPLWAIPQDWTRRRDRCEYGHAVRAGLVTAALGALVASIQPSVEVNK